ncbi:MAG: phospho-sugar mutase, partial [Bacteroidota bacterium]
IRHFGSQSGVMLTASHNPKEYNGYKAYGDDGGQLVSPADKAVLTEVRQVTAEDVKFDGDDSLIHLIGAEVDELYLKELTRLSLSPEAIRAQHDISIVFSPIHGTGGVLVPDYLKKLGFTNIHLVQEQMVVDGNFPTVIYPNPEEAEALALAIKLAKDVDADLVMATDPDADRVGIAIKNDHDQHILLNGNQTAVLLFGYVLDRWSNGGRLAGSEYIVKTIVTTYLLDRIAESYGVDCYNTLTGFKHIGALMSANQGAKSFIVGGEESYGYLVGEHARDKDAVVSCGMLAEMAAYYRNEGKSLYDALLDTYVEHGLYQEKLVALTKKGKSGAEEIEQMISTFRNDPPKTLGGVDVVRIKDYQLQIDHDLLTDEKSSIDLPVSNVLQFFTADGSIVSARPSGTEPKIKFYCSVNTTLDSKQEYAEKQVLLHKRIEAICADLGV